MCYSILECLLGKLQSQLAALNDNMGQSCLKPNRRRHFKACPCWVSITFRYHSTYQSGVMVISFLSQHTPLVDSKGQLPFSVQWVDSKGQPPFSVQQGQYPMLEMGSQTYEMQTPRTTVVLQKLRVRQDEYILVQKKVTKTVVVMAEYTCIVYLYASQVGRQPSQPHTGLCSPAMH